MTSVTRAARSVSSVTHGLDRITPKPRFRCVAIGPLTEPRWRGAQRRGEGRHCRVRAQPATRLNAKGAKDGRRFAKSTGRVRSRARPERQSDSGQIDSQDPPPFLPDAPTFRSSGPPIRAPCRCFRGQRTIQAPSPDVHARIFSADPPTISLSGPAPCSLLPPPARSAPTQSRAGRGAQRTRSQT